MRVWFFEPGGAATAVTFEFAASTVNAAPASTTVTFSSHALGTAAASRKIVVGVAKGGGSVDSVTSVTVASVSATLVIASGGGTSAYTEIWQAAVPTGTTGDIVVVVSGPDTPGRLGVGVFAVYDAASAATDTGNSSADPSTDTINVPANGVLVGNAINVSNTTFTWTGVTEKYDEQFGGTSVQSGAADTFAEAQTGLSITADGALAGDSRMTLASWGPA